MQERKRRKPGEAKSPIETEIPEACRSEEAAVAFLERERWPEGPVCPNTFCGSKSVYAMTDKDGGRSKRFLWRCREKECGRQFTVRISTVFEESRVPLRIWLYAMFRACSSKKGISALQIKRECGLSYKSALYLMHRIRFAMSDDGPGPLSGIVETDETPVGGKAKNMHAAKRAEARKAGFPKVPVVAFVERGGRVRTKVMPTVTWKNLHAAIRANVDPSATVMTDDGYRHDLLRRDFAGHEWVNHSAKEYARGIVHTNTVEGFFSLFKRRIHGTHHAVSPAFLGLYAAEAAFLYSTRKVDDGERTTLAIRGTVGKRFRYRKPA